MTNRLDMIDSAILRPGRLEVHIEIGLPNEEGRLQILAIHTGQMNENGYLDSDVSLPTLAAELKNYTGAEIAGICRTAAAYTLKQQIDLSDIKNFKVDRTKLKVKMEHFRYAAEESKPAFGVKDDELKLFYRNGIIDYGPGYQSLRGRLDAIVNQVREIIDVLFYFIHNKLLPFNFVLTLLRIISFISLLISGSCQ